MSAEVILAPDAERAMEIALDLCRRSNIAIASAEHLVAGALTVLAERLPGLPSQSMIEAALLQAQGESDVALTHKVMWGSAARDVISASAAHVRRAGGGPIDARALVHTALASGEVSPMFLAALGVERTALVALLESVEPDGAAWPRSSCR